MDIQTEVPLAGLTTLELGGRAEHYVEAPDGDAIREAVRWARQFAKPLWVLGGGSNTIVPDQGVEGLVLRITSEGVAMRRDGEHVLVRVEAGEPWDRLVTRTVEEGLAGLECLGGIPGAVGATPIQNVGAYGQDVSESIRSVEVLDTETLELKTLAPHECEFGYRDSWLKRNPTRYVVLAVEMRLRPGGDPKVAYRELAESVGTNPSLRKVHHTVLALRRRKSMVLDADDPNRRSAGSFFTNPIVSSDVSSRVVDKAMADGIVSTDEEVPRWTTPHGTKLAAAWLIERAGFSKGARRGNVGLSSKHTLAIVHHGGATTAELLAFADEISGRVERFWGVRLEREPRILGAL